MKRYPRIRCGWHQTGGVVVAAAMMLTGTLGSAQQTDADRQSSSPSVQKEALSTLVYVPHDFDAPVVTESGGARGAGRVQVYGDVPEIHLLAPPKLARTLSRQPTLHWYLSGPSRAPVRLTLLDFDDIAAEPLVEIRFDAIEAAGVYGFSLAEHDVRLEKGSRYEWSVALEVNPESYSDEPVAKTILAAVEPDPALLAKLEDAPVRAQVEMLAEHGYWYDAIDLLSQQTADGDGPPWRELRAQLLEQEEVGLDAVAAFDRAVARSQ